MANKESWKKEYPLHKCIFQGDVKALNTLIKKKICDIAEKDVHGKK